jgi:hypothetical protein
MNKIKEVVSENLSVEVTPDENYEFLMTTSEVAKGYGVSSNTIRTHKSEHKEEFIEGKHFIVVGNNNMNRCNRANHVVGKTDADCLSGSYPFKTVLWTKRGIVRLGFFIKSERARMFRDWAEDLVINKVEEAQHIVKQSKQLALWPEDIWMDGQPYMHARFRAKDCPRVLNVNEKHTLVNWKRDFIEIRAEK